MNHLNTYLVHYAAIIAGVCSLLAGLDPKVLGPEGAAVVGAAMTGVAIAHALGIKPATIAKTVAPLLLVALLLPGCKTVPTANQQAGITVLVDAATGVVVQKGTSDPAVWASRARQITAIAGQLEALDTGSTATLPALTQALEQLIAKAHLGPADLLAANTFVATLEQLITAQVKAAPSTSATQATVLLVLQDVIQAASVYETTG